MALNETLNQRQLDQKVASAIHDQWGFYLTEGIILLVLGLLAILIPPAATISVTIVIGAVFLASGVVGLISTFSGHRAPGFWWSLISAALGIVVGLMLLVRPIAGAVSLTLVLIAFFIAEGVFSILFGLSHRRHVSNWGWMVASGVVDLALAGILLAGLPGDAAWALGLLVGINLIFGGAALAAIALRLRTSSSLPRS
ncbi:MAG TPA: HdeD family acid-resistance protein [Methylocystis sp.]|nr:HdeD family acid-resistance protein [Methylocystis sp.]